MGKFAVAAGSGASGCGRCVFFLPSILVYLYSTYSDFTFFFRFYQMSTVK